MVFQQIEPGHYERPFDTLELFYRGIAAKGAHLGKTQYLVSSAIQLKALPSLAQLHRAWTALRYQHPLIAAVAHEERAVLTYSVPSQAQLEEWLHETVIVHENQSLPATDLDPDIPASPMVTLHVLPQSQELFFRSQHWRLDGHGMILLQHEFLTLLAQGTTAPEFDGSEVSNIPPGLDEALGLSTEVTNEMKAGVESELSALAVGPTPMSFTRSSCNQAPGVSRRVTTRIPRDISQQLIMAAKRRGLKVTAAVQTALFLASRPHLTPEDGRLVCFNTYNVRNEVPAPWNGSRGATGLYHTGRPFSIELGATDFDTVANSLTAHYQCSLTPLWSLMPFYVQTIGAMLAAPIEIANQAPGAAHPELSSLGVIEDRLPTVHDGPAATVEIKDWWLGVQILDPILQTYLWTRDGEIHLSCHYNEAFYERKLVESLLESWKETLADDLLA